MIIDCKACRGDWPPAGHRIGDCGFTQAYLFEDQFFPGWTLLVLKRHATELFQLTAQERGGVMEELSAVANVLATRYEAKKINYELLGNQLPHIHWHVIPRRAQDPEPREPVWRVEHQAVALSFTALAHELDRLRQDLARALPGFAHRG